jgi:PAS domain S-box-containing protein
MLSGPRGDLAARAATSEGMVATLIDDPPGKRVVFALAREGAEGAVAFADNAVHPESPPPDEPGSPFSQLRIALYGSDKVEASKLIFTTETELPLTGHLLTKQMPTGADTWLLVVGSRGPLVGDFARRAPWLLLGGGLLAAAFAALAAQALSRRRTYALDLVRIRTRELDETRAFLDRLVTGAPVVVRRFALSDRRTTYVSPNVEREFGIDAERAKAQLFAELVHAGERESVDGAFRLVAEGTTQRQAIEHRMRMGDAERWVATVFVPETDPDGQIRAVLGYSLDINDRRRAEQAQREAQEAADSANRSKSEFLSRMSHELRTPLNAVVGFSQLLQMDDLTDSQREAVGQILRGGRHLLDLINEVLDISRIEAGHLALSPEPVHVRDLVEDAVDLIRPLGQDQGIQVVADRASCDCYVFADRQRAKQILLNLLSNAVKYNRPRGTVAVTCSRQAGSVVISVADTGPGIPAELMPKLFAPFDRLGAENTSIEGTGIGLALSNALAAAMSGRLTVDSTVGRGSVFSVELPSAEGPVERYERLEPASAPAGTAAVTDAGPATDGRPRPGKILHIEDNLSNLKLVERIAAMRGGLEVIPAMHGGLGLELAREHMPSLIILDLHLPDLNGAEVLRRLHEDPVTSSIPVVIASADASPGQAQRLVAAGALAYLTKPIDVAELLAIIDDRLAREGRGSVPGR